MNESPTPFDNAPKVRTAFVAVTVLETPCTCHNDNEFVNKAVNAVGLPSNGEFKDAHLVSAGPSFGLVA